MNLNENIDRIKNLMGISNPYKEDIISEGLSDILYHFTTLLNLVKILETDKFYARMTYFNKKEYNLTKKRNFFFSATRNKSLISNDTSDFALHPVRIKLDGRKLSQRYKGAAVDFFGYSYQPSTKSPKSENAEFEDRIMLDEPYIENASKYILGINILLSVYDFNKESSEETSANIKPLNEIITICKEKNIPLAFFGNKKDFMINRNPINSVEWFTKQKRRSKDEEYNYLTRHLLIIALISYKNKTPIKELFPDLTDSNIETINGILTPIKNDSHYKYYFFRELLPYIQSIGESFTPTSRDVTYKLIKDMRKYNTRNIEEYIKIKLE